MITPRHVVVNSQLFQQEHILNQKLSRELRYARRELKREAYFAKLQVSKLAERVESANRKLEQGRPLSSASKNNQIEHETSDVTSNTRSSDVVIEDNVVMNNYNSSLHSTIENRNENERRPTTLSHSHSLEPNNVSKSHDRQYSQLIPRSPISPINRKRRKSPAQAENNTNRPAENLSEDTFDNESKTVSEVFYMLSPSLLKSKQGETFIGFQGPRNLGACTRLRTSEVPFPGSLCIVRFEPGEPERIRFLTLPTIKIADLSCAPKERDIAIFDGNTGKVFIFDASCWDSMPEEVTAVYNRKISKLKSCSGRNLALVTVDGEGLILESPQHSKDYIVEHLAKQLKIVEVVRIPGEQIVALEKFDRGVAVLTKSGKIYTRGTNPFNLGYENTAENSNEFRLLKSLQNEHIIQISFSDFHACALSKHGTVYSWGCPDEGRLGLGMLSTPNSQHSTVYNPTRIDFFQTQRVVKVEAGHFVSAMLTDTGQLYTCGAGKYMTLGHGSQQDEWLPRRIDYLADRMNETEFVVDFYFSGFQLTLISNYGRVYVCGMDSYTYAPGRDNERWNTTPHLLSPALNRLYIEKAAGSFVMAFLIGKTPVIELN